MDMNRIDLDDIHLAKGGHDSPDNGLCLLEAAAYLAGEVHSDHPACVSPILGTFGRELNDQLDDTKRQQLKPMIPALLGTGGDSLDDRRSYLALDWLIRTYTPAWLDLAGLGDQAAELRALRRIVDLTTAEAANPIVRAAGDAAEDAAWGVAGGVAWDVARDVARAAGGDAAGDAAWGVAGDAAWDVARDVARDAASWT